MSISRFFVSPQAAPFVYVEEHNFEVNGVITPIHTCDLGYDGNIFLSLREVADALKDTEYSFGLTISDSSIAVTKGNSYELPEEYEPWNEEFIANLRASQSANKMTVDEREVKYFTVKVKDAQGACECFISYVDLAMILNVCITCDENENLVFDTERSFDIDPMQLQDIGFFQGVNAVLVGDATTGEIYYSYQADNPYPIASTTKLMTYFLTMDAVSEGTLGMDTKCRVSAVGEMLSKGQDGVIPVNEGKEIPVSDLIMGIMLPSSNEFALTLGETIGGSEEAFVQMMNDKAKELNLKSSHFYTTNGLPYYENTVASAKVQNVMSAKDMFKMCSVILRNYPEIKEVTSTKKFVLESVGNTEIQNSNLLLYNMDEVTGLKTGTTTKAGACLVTSIQADDHDLLVVLLGAEGNPERIGMSEVLSRYALNRYRSGSAQYENNIENAEDIVRCVLRKAA